MNAPKPYGLDREQDLRWECLALAATCGEYDSPLHVIAAAELYAGYVADGAEVVIGPEKGVSVPVETTIPDGTTAKVIPLGKRPS